MEKSGEEAASFVCGGWVGAPLGSMVSHPKGAFESRQKSKQGCTFL
jgi:hypothetical protein